MPVKRKTQKVTQCFHSTHKGVDLRSVDFTTWRLQKIIATEGMTVLRMGRDKYGNGFVVCKPDNIICDEIKYIHVKADTTIHTHAKLKKGDLIGYTEIAGNSKAHHLHFETWSEGHPFNPLRYFDNVGIKYKE